MKEFYKSKIKDLLREGYYFCKDIIDFQGRKRLKKNIILRDQYKGERSFLLLTGEPLEQIDINELKNEYTFSTGYVFLHEDIRKMDLTFYLNPEANRAFPPGASHWPKSHLGPLGHEGVVAFYREIDERLESSTTLFLNSDNYKYVEINNLFKDKTKYFVKGKRYLHVIEGVPYQIIADLTRRSISGEGSVFLSILILMYMGFKEIYLCGAGYTYNPEYVLHFYDNIVFPKSMGKEEAVQAVKKAIFIRKREGGSVEYSGLLEKGDLYRGICIRRKNENNPQHYEYHRKINKYAKSQGVRIINIVPDGFESPVYEKISWGKVVSEVLPNK